VFSVFCSQRIRIEKLFCLLLIKLAPKASIIRALFVIELRLKS